MPTYEYRCSACGYDFEEFQSIRAESLEKCPVCGQPALKRLLGGGGGMIFKGSGFYLTDYKKNGGREKTGSNHSGKKDEKEKPKDAPTSDPPTSTTTDPKSGSSA